MSVELTGTNHNAGAEMHSDKSINNTRLVGGCLIAIGFVAYVILLADICNANILMDLRTETDLASENYGEYLNVSAKDASTYIDTGVGVIASSVLLGFGMQLHPTTFLNLFKKVFPDKKDNEKTMEPLDVDFEEKAINS